MFYQYGGLYKSTRLGAAAGEYWNSPNMAIKAELATNDVSKI